MGLEEMIAKINKDYEKVAFVSDIHVPFQDNDALELTKAYLRDYRPDKLVLNGDLLDFYTLSTFDKNPERKVSVQEELDEGSRIIKDLRNAVGKQCDIYMTEGNHENRLQRYLWNNPELEGLRDLKLDKLLHLKEHGVKYVNANMDYWKKDTGHLKIGDVVVMHGDNRLNGGSCSAKSGYSAHNTMVNMQSSVIMGHVHRLGIVYKTNPYGTTFGIEQGSLCQPTGTANWQQGFATFELEKGKAVNPRIYPIKDGKLYAGNDIYHLE